MDTDRQAPQQTVPHVVDVRVAIVRTHIRHPRILAQVTAATAEAAAAGPLLAAASPVGRHQVRP